MSTASVVSLAAFVIDTDVGKGEVKYLFLNEANPLFHWVIELNRFQVCCLHHTGEAIRHGVR